jgi:hypothetical protein
VANEAPDPDQFVRRQSFACGLGRRRHSIFLSLRLGTLPPPAEFESYFGLRGDQAPGDHWSDWSPSKRWSPDAKARSHLPFAEFCAPYEAIELWFDPDPNDQLQLVWLLDYFRLHPEAVAKLKLRLIDFNLNRLPEQMPEEEDVPVVDLSVTELETASASWQAYRAKSPQACFDLVHSDLSAFPLLKPTLLKLLQELPSRATGLGATEMRLLEMIARGYTHANELFYLSDLGQGRIFDEFEIGCLLEGLALNSRPAVAGVDDELRVLEKKNTRFRVEAFRRSRLSLTEFGKLVLAYKEDFSRHNPIDRWWGGTHLTNDRLWRWNPALMKP